MARKPAFTDDDYQEERPLFEQSMDEYAREHHMLEVDEGCYLTMVNVDRLDQQ